MTPNPATQSLACSMRAMQACSRRTLAIAGPLSKTTRRSDHEDQRKARNAVDICHAVEHRTILMTGSPCSTPVRSWQPTWWPGASGTRTPANPHCIQHELSHASLCAMSDRKAVLTRRIIWRGLHVGASLDLRPYCGDWRLI